MMVSNNTSMGRESHIMAMRRISIGDDPELAALKSNFRSKNIAHGKAKSTKAIENTNNTCEKIVRHPLFENATLIIIILNALWLWIDADYNDAPVLNDADIGFQLVEHMFCFFFTGEWVIRFFSVEEKCYAFRDPWFLFDTVLVSLMVIETWVMTIIFATSDRTSGLGSASVLRLVRLLRLLRIARMVRILRALPELLILIKGMAAATRSVCYALGLIVIQMYIFGIIFKNVAEDSEVGDTYFGSVGGAMYTLLIFGTFLDSVGILMGLLKDYDMILACVFLIYILLSALMVMNLVIGVLCEVVAEVSHTEKELMAIEAAVHKFNLLVNSIDEDNDGTISKKEFLELMKKNDTVATLEDLGLDAMNLIEGVDTIFENNEELPVADFIEIIMRFRGGHPATLKDIVDLRSFIVKLHKDKDFKDKDLANAPAPSHISPVKPPLHKDPETLELPGSTVPFSVSDSASVASDISGNGSTPWLRKVAHESFENGRSAGLPPLTSSSDLAAQLGTLTATTRQLMSMVSSMREEVGELNTRTRKLEELAVDRSHSIGSLSDRLGNNLSF